MNAFTAELGARVQDYIEVEQPDDETCSCEQGLQATRDRLVRDLTKIQDELVSLKQAEQDAWTLAEEVLQAETLEGAKEKARIYLGLADPF